jgi:hypothetical protein
MVCKACGLIDPDVQPHGRGKRRTVVRIGVFSAPSWNSWLNLRQRTLREHSAHALPNLVGRLGKVQGLFRRGEPRLIVPISSKNIDFPRGIMVGATGIEPVTPTMSR